MYAIAALALAARVALALVFAVAGVTKLLDRQGTREALAGFGAPRRSAATLALALSLAEIAVAGLLLPASTALYGAVGALALLVLFTGAIAWSLARGRTPDCHCFGQLHAAPVSWKTIVRNAILTAVAGVAVLGSVVEPPVSALAWIAGLSSAELVALVAVAIAAMFAVAGGTAFTSLLRSYGRLLRRLDRVEAALAHAGISVDELEMPDIGLGPGTPLPFFAATAVGGEPISPETLAASGTPTLFLFASPQCGPCATLMPRVAEWQREHRDRLTVVVASSGSLEEVEEEAHRHGLERVLHDGDNRLAELFQANGTPSAVLVAQDGTIASWLASGAEWIEELVEQVLGGEGDEAGLPLGAEIPDLALPSLAGETTTLDALRGRDTLLLFWNPACGYCRSMHEDVLAWEASANGVTPRLVVVSSGDAEATRHEGFRSLVLLDEEFAAGAAFNAGGTPMAVLIDADGRIASPVAAGADAVLALANGHG